MIVEISTSEDQAGPRSLAEHAYDQLVRKITRIELRPGTVLGENHLSKQLGIGRTPVREALQKLSAEGLVCHLPHRGMYVCEIDSESVQQIFEFRTMIDSNMARLAAVRASDQQVSDLVSLDDHLADSIEQNDIDDFVRTDWDFHRTLALASQNIHIEEVMPRIFHQQLRLMFFISEKTGGWRPIASSHEDMTRNVADAISRRQPEEAELAMKLYVIRQHGEVRGHL